MTDPLSLVAPELSKQLERDASMNLALALNHQGVEWQPMRRIETRQYKLSVDCVVVGLVQS